MDYHVSMVPDGRWAVRGDPKLKIEKTGSGCMSAVCLLLQGPQGPLDERPIS